MSVCFSNPPAETTGITAVAEEREHLSSTDPAQCSTQDGSWTQFGLLRKLIHFSLVMSQSWTFFIKSGVQSGLEWSTMTLL